MKRGVFSTNKGKPKILGISSGNRSKLGCAREDPVSLYYLKLALKAAKKAGAQVKLIDLRGLKIGPCKECYSTNPAHCRFNEQANQCDCYLFKEDTIIFKNKIISLEKAYDILPKKLFFNLYKNAFAERDDMWLIYKAMREADGIIFATSTHYYSRPALLQNMFSRLTALDGGVEELWGDGKNLRSSIKYSKNPQVQYKQRLYNKHCAFINCSKEGDSVTPDLMKACTMMGMKIIPLAVAHRVNWYYDPTHRSDTLKSKKDPYTLSLLNHIGTEIVKLTKKSDRTYGKYSKVV